MVSGDATWCHRSVPPGAPPNTNLPCVRDYPPSLASEDFSFMLEEKSGCYVWLGNGPGEGGCMLHNPHYDFNDDILHTGISYWINLVKEELAL